MKKIIGVIFSLAFGLIGNYALAQSDYALDGTSAGAGLGMGLIILWVVMMIVSILLFIFWILMLIDCIKRDFDQKVLWIVLIIVLGYLGAIIYYFAVKRKGNGNKEMMPTETETPMVAPMMNTSEETKMETPEVATLIKEETPEVSEQTKIEEPKNQGMGADESATEEKKEEDQNRTVGM